jgi:membrane protease YdiL (CAAX protease family)
LAYNDQYTTRAYEYSKDHPKWFGVPAEGGNPPVKRHIPFFALLLFILVIELDIWAVTDTLMDGALGGFSNYIIWLIFSFTFGILITVNKIFGNPFKSIKFPFILQVFFIIVIEICIWAVYRYSTAEFFGQFGTFEMYAFHIVFAPIIHLIPIFLAWRYWWNERRRLPFVFSRKLILSGVIVGFMAAIIWRVLEELVYDGVAGAAGGTFPGTFTFWNLLETPLLFGIMTFTHFFIVGPVEELEFRGFTQDQAARVLPNWQAVVFSSVLFGCSHIPIAIFLYRFPPATFAVALIGWISAGFVFGFLYMWSRSIYACIVMHGMGNWQLSVFYFASIAVPGWELTFEGVLVGTITSVIVNVIMIILFYIFHKLYWEPHRRGEPAFLGLFMSFQRFMHDHDFEKKSIGSTSFIAVLFCVIICGMLMGAAVSVGTVYPTGEGAVEEDTVNFESWTKTTDTLSDSGYMDEGTSVELNMTSEPDKYIQEVIVEVTWTDEDDMQRLRTYENNPDAFSITITGLGQGARGQGENTHGSPGSASANLTFSFDQINIGIVEVGENYNVIVDISMDMAGDYFTRFGALGFQDPGNDYSYQIDITYLTPP